MPKLKAARPDECQRQCRKGNSTFPILPSKNKPQATQQEKDGLLREDAAEDFGHVGSNAEGLQNKNKMKPAQGSESPMLQGFE